MLVSTIIQCILFYNCVNTGIFNCVSTRYISFLVLIEYFNFTISIHIYIISVSHRLCLKSEHFGAQSHLR